MNVEAKPIPHPDEVSKPYWEGLARGVLRLQRCSSCGKVRHYPRLVCDACYSLDVEWIDASGRGTLHSWTIAHHAFHAGFKADLPYVIAIVDLAEGVRAMGRLNGVAHDAIRVGMPLRFQAEHRTPDGLAMPAFVTA